jgi:hypothetical protein
MTFDRLAAIQRWPAHTVEPVYSGHPSGSNQLAAMERWHALTVEPVYSDHPSVGCYTEVACPQRWLAHRGGLLTKWSLAVGGLLREFATYRCQSHDQRTSNLFPPSNDDLISTHHFLPASDPWLVLTSREGNVSPTEAQRAGRPPHTSSHSGDANTFRSGCNPWDCQLGLQ